MGYKGHIGEEGEKRPLNYFPGNKPHREVKLIDEKHICTVENILYPVHR